MNLSPADMQKEGSHFDLPIALGLLVAMEVLAPEDLATYVALGELGLDGALIPVAGVLPAAIGANARERGLICPAANGAEAAWAGGGEVVAPADLLALINHFKGTQLLAPPKAAALARSPHYPDLRDIKGQETAKRAVELAAAGGHNLLMMGPPGTGKSMLASRLPGILPPLAPEEALSVSMIASVAGLLGSNGLTRSRPFPRPAPLGLDGGDGGRRSPRPSRGGLARPSRRALPGRAARVFPAPCSTRCASPSRAGAVAVARANAHVRYPARFQLVAAMNPCRCGYLSDPARARLHPRASLCARLPGAHLGPALRPDRPPRGRTGALRRRPRATPARRRLGRGRGAGRGRPRGPAGRASAPWTRRPTSAPMRRPRASCSPKSPRPTRADGTCLPKRPTGSGSRPAAITACSRSRARLRTWAGPRLSRAGTSPKRSPTAASAPYG